MSRHIGATRRPKAVVFAARVLDTADGRAAMSERDAAYHNGDPDTSGPRHRLVMTDRRWRLEDW